MSQHYFIFNLAHNLAAIHGRGVNQATRARMKLFASQAGERVLLALQSACGTFTFAIDGVLRFGSHLLTSALRASASALLL